MSQSCICIYSLRVFWKLAFAKNLWNINFLKIIIIICHFSIIIINIRLKCCALEQSLLICLNFIKKVLHFVEIRLLTCGVNISFCDYKIISKKKRYIRQRFIHSILFFRFKIKYKTNFLMLSPHCLEFILWAL